VAARKLRNGEFPRRTCNADPLALPEQQEDNMTWETPEYTVIEVCAEATGYFYRGD
jgi:hypothetical protein